MNAPCPVCGKVYAIRPEQHGRKIACKQCGARLLATAAGLQPEPAAVPAPPPPAAPVYAPPAAVYAYSPPTPPPPPPAPAFEEPAYDPEPPRRRYDRGGSPVADFLTFRLMLAPVLIQIVFWIGTLASVGMGIREVVGSMDSGRAEVRDDPEERPAGKARPAAAGRGMDTFRFLYGLGLMLIGPVVLRLACEQMIIFFKIHQELREQTDRGRRGG